MPALPQLSGNFKITDTNIHPHLQARMRQRGVTREEIERTINDGWQATDAKQGTLGKVLVFPYEKEWEGRFFAEKEVTVYYKVRGEECILLTVKARYGQGFRRK
jgi:hypothetical protein